MALTSTDQYWGEQLKIKDQEIESLLQQLMIAGKGGSPGQPYDDPEKGKGPFVPAPPRDKLMIAGNPSFDIGPGHGSAKKKAKGFNKTRNNPNDREVEMIKKWLGGPQLPDVSGIPSSGHIRDRLRPFTTGGSPAPYDKESGSLRRVPDLLRIQLLRDAMA
jgi:hypothetical protein